jgi:hypothetical protein
MVGAARGIAVVIRSAAILDIRAFLEGAAPLAGYAPVPPHLNAKTQAISSALENPSAVLMDRGARV